MKKKDLVEIKNKNVSEIKIEVNKLEKELANARLEKSMGKLKNPHTPKSIRKSIAQLKTVLRLKELIAKEAKKEKTSGN